MHPLKLILPQGLGVEIKEKGASLAPNSTTCNTFICFEEFDDGCQKVRKVTFENGNSYQDMQCYYTFEVTVDQKVHIESEQKSANGKTSFVEFTLSQTGVQILDYSVIEIPYVGNEENNDGDSIETPETTDTELQVGTYKFGPSMEIKRTSNRTQKQKVHVKVDGYSNNKEQEVETQITLIHVYKPFSKTQPFLLVQ
ncbi:unnamed protein product [Wickerhamomyces anomalus]